MQWRIGPFLLDTENACLWREMERLTLRPKAFDMLVYLVQHAGDLITKEDLLEAVWPNTIVAESALTTTMSELRRVLGETVSEPRFIATVHRRGYRFIASVERLDPSMDSVTPLKLLDADEPSSFRSSAIAPSSSAILIDREQELALLDQRLRTARDGRRQLLFVTGEAGIGKTTLVDGFVDQLASSEPVWIARGQCVEQYGAGEAYMPLLDILGQLGRRSDGKWMVELLYRQAPSWLLQLPALVDDDAYDALQRRMSGVTRERMLRELAEAMESLTTTQALVLVLEDLHWSDASTIEWLGYMARRRGTAQLLILGTYRPVEALVHAHPVQMMLHDLQMRGQGEEIVLGYLSAAGVITYLQQRLGVETLPAELAQILHQRTNGHPLFLTIMVDAFVQKGVLFQGRIGWTMVEDWGEAVVELPANLRLLINQQIEQVPIEDRTLLEAASVAGDEFAVTAVASVIDCTDEDVENRCENLSRQSSFIRSCGTDAWPDGTIATRYRFTHDMYREVCYDRVPIGRCTRWHRQIGIRLEIGYGDLTHELAAELAVHFERGRDVRRAVVYLKQAADNALFKYAYAEAVSHLTKAISLLQALPDTTERTHQELALLIALGPAMIAIKGYGDSEVERTYSRARELCHQVGDSLQLAQVLWGLVAFCIVRAQYQTAQVLGEQLLTLTQRHQDTVLKLAGHFALGMPLYCLGEFVSAREHLEQGVAFYDESQHETHTLLFGIDLGVFCRSWLAHVLWHLGYPDQALDACREAIMLAEKLAHPFSLALALAYAVMLHQFRREAHRVHLRIDSVLTLCTQHGFAYYLAWGTIFRGWMLVEQGRNSEGMSQMRQGLTALRHTGGEARLPYYLSMLAEAYGQTGQSTAGLTLLAEALDHVHQTGERWREAELYRLQGELFIRKGIEYGASDASQCFHRALEIARRQQAKAFELRAAMSLSRLWYHQGQPEAARELLAGVYYGFSEGWDTADLTEAKVWLEELTQ